MENASKALIMAGGVLVALLVIGVLLLMFNNVGEYQRSKNANKQSSQIAKFNMDFERYTDSKGITGADVLSLINKVNDYNRRSYDNENSGESSQATNYVDYRIKMTMRVTGLERFNNLYAYEGNGDKLFTQDYFDIDFNSKRGNTLDERIKNIEDFTNLEHFIKSDKLKQLSALYNRRLSRQQNIDNMVKELPHLGIDNITEDVISDNLDLIRLYRQYSEFKLSTFRAYEDNRIRPKYADNGQIQSLYFEFIK